MSAGRALERRGRDAPVPRRVGRALGRALDVLVPHLDVVHGRAEDPRPPAWCESRGWTGFLLGLTDPQLARCESLGLAACLPELGPEVPPSLADLGAQVSAEVSRSEWHAPASERAGIPAKQRSVAERKQAQIEALLRVAAPLAARARRVVDIGAGRGHFTHAASDSFGVEALGLDRSAALVAAAERLYGAGPFRVLHAGQDPLPLETSDLAVGLHACGALGDHLVVAAAAARAHVLLVSCCLQKIAAPARQPLSEIALKQGFLVAKSALGLSNLTSRPIGVEASIEDMLRSRQTRYALRRWLAARGAETAPGEEMRGVNRRQARHGLFALATRVAEARGWSAPTEAEVREHERASEIEVARIRRFSLPRAMLARPFEIAVVCDRGSFLEERGFDVVVRAFCGEDITPRNLALVAVVDP